MEIVKNKDGSVRKIVLKNGSTIEFNGKKDPYQSRCIEDDAWIVADDWDWEKLNNEIKARNVPSKINLGYKGEKQ